jgi:hypothetical protein
METLPGIAQVLRSPVADALVNLIRAASGTKEFSMADAEEILKYAVRRNLMNQEESDRVLVEARDLVAARAQRALDRENARKASSAPAAAKPAPAPKAKATPPKATAAANTKKPAKPAAPPKKAAAPAKAKKKSR